MSTAPRLTLYHNPYYSSLRQGAPPANAAKKTAWRRMSVWVYASLLIGVLALIVIWQNERLQRQVMLLDANARPVIRVDIYNDYLKMYPQQAIMTAKSSDLELWALQDNASPVSLGLISPLTEDWAGINFVQQSSLKGARQLAITLEQRGGAKHGQPQGPTLYISTPLRE
ncbi:hypothetical protein Pfra02_19010 [Pseudomonas fragi]|nr:hypothetical protein Pfra02_19010 [Pseudomonas fragi]